MAVNPLAYSLTSRHPEVNFRPQRREEMVGTPVNYDPSRADGGLPMTKVETFPQWFLDNKAAREAEIESRRPPSAAEKIAARDEAARQQDPAARYQAALGLGADFVTFMNSNINVVNAYGRKDTSIEFNRGRHEGQDFTHVSAQGTVIGVDRGANWGSIETNTLQITRKDGFQVNLELSDDLRINDLEDGGLSIYYASSGISRIFDAEGRETTVHGEKNALGTSGDDIIINVCSKCVDAGEGDDVILNFADNVEILGGAGNDKILLYSADTKGVTINGGAGDDDIVGYGIWDSTIIMEDGKDSLTSTAVWGSTIAASGDDTLKTSLYKSTLISRNGVLDMDMGSILESSLTIDRAKAFSTGLISGSHLTFGDGDVSMYASMLSESRLTTGSGNDVITVGSMCDSILNTGDGNDLIQNEGFTRSSTIDTGRGTDTITYEEKDYDMIVKGAENIKKYSRY